MTPITQSTDSAERERNHFTQEEVSRLAYQLWKGRDGRKGSPLEDWLEAERLLHERDDWQMSTAA